MSQNIENTKLLSLDDRIAFIEPILSGLGLLPFVRQPTQKEAKAVTRQIEAAGYEPMMFRAAIDIIVSRGRLARLELQGNQQQ